MIEKLLNKIHLDFDFGRGEAEQVLGFQTDFSELVDMLAGAYQVDPGVYEQTGAEKRGRENSELNDGKYFLGNLVLNPIKEQGAIREYASGHGAKSYGDGERVKIGRLTVPIETVERLTPDSASLRTVELVVTLAKRAAQLKALTSGEEGIPEAYTLARLQTSKALKLVEDAAVIANGWKSDNWGRLSLEGVLERASKRMFGKQARTAVLVGALALAGCQGVGPGVVTPETGGVTPIATEVVTIPEMVVVDTNEIIPVATPVPYPDSAEGFVLGVGGDVEQLITAIDKVQNGAATDMKNNYIARAWREGRVTGGDWEAAVKNFESKFEIIGSAADEGAPWTLVVRERSSGKVLVAFDAGDNPFLSGMPLGAQSLDSWHLDFVSSDVLPAGQREMVVRVGEGESAGHFVVVRVDESSGEMVSWRNMITRSWVEAPQELDLASLVEPGQEIREVNGYQAIGSEYTAGYPPRGTEPIFEKTEYRMLTIQGQEGTYRALNGKVEKYTEGKWQAMLWPTETREIVFFDIKYNDSNGKQEIYAVDEYGIAVAELNNGQWEKYVREIRGLEDIRSGIGSENFTNGWNAMIARLRKESGVINEPNLDEVVRMVGPDGKLLDWDGWWGQCLNGNDCHIGEVKPRSADELGVVWIPAVMKGVYPGYASDLDVVVMEIPRRYDRVIQFIFLENVSEPSNFKQYYYLGEGNDWEKWWSVRVGNEGVDQNVWIRKYLEAVASGVAPQYQIVAMLGVFAKYDQPGNEIYKTMAELMADQKLSQREFSFSADFFIVTKEMSEFVK